MGRSRGGLTTKIHAVVDARGLPIQVAFSAGRAHDVTMAEEMLAGLAPNAMILGDRSGFVPAKVHYRDIKFRIDR